MRLRSRTWQMALIFTNGTSRDWAAIFLDALYSDIDSLRPYTGIHLIQFGNYHRLLSKRFPCDIYYQVKENSVLVRAVLDLRRDPEWVKWRLQ
jgi:hypothetical protein